MWALTGKCDLHFIWQGSLIIRIKTVIETEAHWVANGRCSLAANTKCWPLNEGDLYWGQREFTIAFLESSHTPVPLPIGIVSDIYLENSLGFLCLFCFPELFFKSLHYPHWVKSPSNLHSCNLHWGGRFSWSQFNEVSFYSTVSADWNLP